MTDMPVARPDRVRVWDPVVRAFHWSLVALFILAYATADEAKDVHLLAGYGIAALVALRLVWGLIGSRHARFSDFIYSPLTVLRFMGDTLRLKAKRYLGHNPAGGAMVIALLIGLIVIAASGYAMTTDAFWGEDWLEEVHETAVYATIALVAAHLVGVAIASLEHRENLVRAMVTGWKRRL